ncbi:MAG: CHAT domain-containing protein [Phycisphaerae bacterium]|nr:CHAT domain-containing protein [Phycisphaerae bacterium]
MKLCDTRLGIGPNSRRSSMKGRFVRLIAGALLPWALAIPHAAAGGRGGGSASATNLLRQAWQYYHAGQRERAVQTASEAVKAISQDAKADSGVKIYALESLGQMQHAVTNRAAAKELWEQALALAERDASTNTVLLGRILTNLTGVYAVLRDAERGEPAAQRAVDLARESRNPKRIAAALVNQAVLRVRQGHYVASKGPLRENFKLADVYRFSASTRSNLAFSIARQFCTETPSPRSTYRDGEDEYEYRLNVAMCAHREGRHEQAFESAEAALVCAQTAHGTNHHTVGYAQAVLSSIMDSLNRYEEAEACQLEALRIFKAEYGESDPGSIEAANQLAALYERKGDYAKAVPILTALLNRTLVQRGWATVTASELLDRAAVCCFKKGDQANAAFLARRLWAMGGATTNTDIERLAFGTEGRTSVTMLGPGSGPEVPSALRERVQQLRAMKMRLAGLELLGPGLRTAAQYEKESESLAREAEILERDLLLEWRPARETGDEPPLMRMGLRFSHEAGIDFERVFDLVAAVRAREAMEDVGDTAASSAETAAVLNNLAVFAAHYRDYATAEEDAGAAYVSVVHMADTNGVYLHGGEESRVAVILNNLAAIYSRTGKGDDARRCCRVATDICDKFPGVKPLDVAILRANQAALEAADKKFKDAKTLYMDALKIAESVDDCPPGLVANILLALGRVYESINCPKSARNAYIKALSVLDRDISASPLESLVVLMCLGDCLAGTDEAEAERMYHEALGIAYDVAPQSAVVFMPLGKLLDLTGKQERYAEAIAICKHMLAILPSSASNQGEISGALREELASLEKGQQTKQLYNPLDFSRNKAYQAMSRGFELSSRMWDAPEEVDDAELGEPDTAALWLLMTARTRVIEGKYDKAGLLLKRALDNQKELGTNSVRLAAMLREYGGILQDLGKIEDAEAAIRQAVSICERAEPSDREELAQSLGSLGVWLAGVARYAEAETNLLRAIDIASAAGGPDDESVAHLRTTLDVVRMNAGVGLDRRQDLRAALTREEQQWGADSHNLASPLTTLAAAEMNAGNIEAAKPLLIRALDIMEKHQAKMAGVHVKPGEKTAGLAHPDIIPVLLSLGAVYAKEENYGEAETMMQRALVAARQAFGSEHKDIARALEGLGNVAYLSGKDLGEVESLYSQALAMREKVLGREHPGVGTILRRIAVLKARDGRYDEALGVFERSIAIQEKTLRDVFSFCSEKERLGLVDDVTAAHSAFLTICVDKLGARGAGSALQYLTRWKGIVLDSMMEDAEAARLSGDPALREQNERLRVARRQLSALVLAGPGNMAAEEYHASVTDLESKVEEMERSMARQSARFREGRASRDIGLAEVAAALPAGSALVEMAEYPPYDFSVAPNEDPFTESHYVAFVLRAGETNPVLVDLGSGVQIGAAVLGYREGVKPRPAPDTNDLASLLVDMFSDGMLNLWMTNLYGRVWAPIEPNVRGSKHIFVSPDGDLNFVPLGALRDSSGRYVLEDYDISYVSSGRDLVRRSMSKTLGERAVVLFGVTNFSEATVPEPALDTVTRATRFRSGLSQGGPLEGLLFPPLANAIAEVDHIAALAAGMGVEPHKYRQSAATEGHVKATLRPAILHFATHGFFLPVSNPWELKKRTSFDNPMHRSGLALAGANLTLAGRAKRGEEDGILTAEEVAGLDLEGTELVVLSACETGLGEARAGEGVLGLRRAFMRAGAENLVMALWQVPDVETRLLMEAFYAKYLGGLSASQALLSAQREALTRERESDRGYNPYRWAAFVASGIGPGMSGSPQKPPAEVNRTHDDSVVTHCEFARLLVGDGEGTQPCSEVFELLTDNGISPSGEWKADSLVTRLDLAHIVICLLDKKSEVKAPDDPASWINTVKELGITMDSIGGALEEVEDYLESHQADDDASKAGEAETR